MLMTKPRSSRFFSPTEALLKMKMLRYLQECGFTLHTIYIKNTTELLYPSQTGWKGEVRKYILKIIPQEGKNLTITRLSNSVPS